MRYKLNKAKLEANDDSSGGLLVMSYNIRCMTVLDVGKRSWFYRGELVLSDMRSAAPDIIGLQEVTTVQYRYLQERLEGFGSLIQYRDNAPWSEGCPIFYNRNKFELTESGSFWLSETPDVMSKGWGAGNYRICTYAVLSDKKDHSRVAVFNTHLDHKSEEARIRGMEVIQKRMDTMENIPVILMGDMNASETSGTYRYISQFLGNAGDMAERADQGSTYHNWGKEPERPAIDYIMVTPDQFSVERFFVIRNLYDGIYPSDHFPICARLTRKNS